MKDADQRLLDALQAQDPEAVKRSIADGADANLLVTGIPVLVEAASSGNIAVTRALLEGGADPNFRTTLGVTPLMLLAVVAQQVHMPVIRLLLDAGADPAAQDKDGLRAIAYFERFDGHRSREIGTLLSSHKDLRGR